jgi:hypothetical protein
VCPQRPRVLLIAFQSERLGEEIKIDKRPGYKSNMADEMQFWKQGYSIASLDSFGELANCKQW